VDGLDLVLSREGAEHQNGADGVIQVADAELKIGLGGGGEVPSNFTNHGTATVAGGGTIRIVGSGGNLDVPSNFTNYGTVTVAGGGTVRVVGGSGEASPMVMVNLGFIDLEAGGTFSLIAAIFDNPASGQVRGSGTLELTQSAGVDFDGTLSPGLSPGILTVDGSMDVGPSTRIAIEVGGETPGSNLDRLDLTGTLGAGGVLDVALIDPYRPGGGERYQVLTFDRLDGWFSSVALPPLNHLLGWNVDVGEHEVGLQVVCQGTDLEIALEADRNPVSIGYDVVYQVTVRNLSAVAATNVMVGDVLPAELGFVPDLSSPECVLVGSTVECTTPNLGPAATWELAIAARPVVTGPVDNTGSVSAWECDADSTNDQATAIIDVVAAAPCDANYDLSVDADDLVPAVGHIFGEVAAGNPDCRLAGGITADDLAAIIEAGQ
jgi:uncharacterized repeat protein (TIGR01451 family)